MFEQVQVTYRLNPQKVEALDGSEVPELLLKIKQLRKYHELLANNNIPEETKQKIRKPKGRGMLLKQLKKVLNDKPIPEDTYEVWHQCDNLRLYRQDANVYANFDEVISRIIQEVSQEVNDQDDHGEADAQENDQPNNAAEDEVNILFGDEKEQDANTLETRFNTHSKLLNASSRRAKQELLIRTSGLEMIPLITMKASHYHHLSNLNFFLHLCILNKKWALAYKIFCIMIRMPDIDVKTVWPLGIEVLRGKSAETSDSVFKVKENRFFSWLSSFYSLRYLRPFKSHNAPLFKAGSFFRAPLYTIMSLWSLLDNGKYLVVKEELETLILQRPFSDEGVFSFILCLCYLMENNRLATKYETIDRAKDPLQNGGGDSESVEEDIFLDNKADIFQKISKNFESVEVHEKRCEALNFQYPEEIIDYHIQSILKRLENADREEEGDRQDDEIANGDLRGDDTNDYDYDYDYEILSPEENEAEDEYENENEEHTDNITDGQVQVPASSPIVSKRGKPESEMDFDFNSDNDFPANNNDTTDNTVEKTPINDNDNEHDERNNFDFEFEFD